MKTTAELNRFYETELMGDLLVLEGQRKAVVTRILLAGGIIVALAAGGVLLLLADPRAILFSVVLAVIAIAGMSKSLARGYTANFKDLVIERIVRFLDPALAYSQTGLIPQGIFTESELFKHHIDRYRGDDLVRGRVGKTAIEFCELHAEYKTRGHKGQTHWHTIFRGLFFIGDFNKHFQGRTFVLPDQAERLFGKFGQTLQSLGKCRGELVRLEDPEFEQSFVVYSDDQIEARYLLSTSLMRRIVEFQRKTKRPLHLAFIGSKIFIALGYTRTLFEPKLFQSLLDFSPIEEYFTDLQTAVGIVEDLNLNTRIWSKQ